MEHTKTKERFEAAQIVPLLRSNEKLNVTIESKTKKDVFEIMEARAVMVQELAKEFSKNNNESTRQQLNKACLHLNGELHVLSKYFGSAEQENLNKIQLAANKAVEEAAKATKREVKYVSITDITSSDMKSAPEHLHERLFHPESINFRTFRESVEKEVLSELHKKGFDEEQLMFNLFTMKKLIRAGEAKNEGFKTPEIEKYSKDEEHAAAIKNYEKCLMELDFKNAAAIAKQSEITKDDQADAAARAYEATLLKWDFNGAERLAKKSAYGPSKSKRQEIANKVYDQFMSKEGILDNTYYKAAQIAEYFSLGQDKIKTAAKKAYSYALQDHIGGGSYAEQVSYARHIAEKYRLTGGDVQSAAEQAYEGAMERKPHMTAPNFKRAAEIAKDFDLGSDKVKSAAGRAFERDVSNSVYAANNRILKKNLADAYDFAEEYVLTEKEQREIVIKVYKSKLELDYGEDYVRSYSAKVISDEFKLTREERRDAVYAVYEKALSEDKISFASQLAEEFKVIS